MLGRFRCLAAPTSRSNNDPLLGCMSLVFALRYILRRRAISVANGVKAEAEGRRSIAEIDAFDRGLGGQLHKAASIRQPSLS
jgi:hypothetical protein